MANMQTGPLLGFIHGLASPAKEDPASDRELLQRFSSRRDEAAFATLVHRHGAMVLHVAQRVLHQRQDAEDVVQATFLVLARKAERLTWRISIANWLYEVAYRLACNARSAAHRRQTREKKAVAKPVSDPLAEISLREALIAFDEALISLSARLRLPLVLCYLEGLTQQKASQRLGVSLATLKRRLVRGREVLHTKLARRGLTLAVIVAAVEVTRGPASAVTPAALVGYTTRAGLAYVAGRLHTETNLARSLHLVRSLDKSLLLDKVKVAVAVATVFICTAGLGIAWRQTTAAKQPGDEGALRANLQSKPSSVERPIETLPEGAVARLGTLQLRQGFPGYMKIMPDGKTFLTLDQGLTLRTWETATGQILQQHSLPLPNSYVEFQAVFTSNGKRLVLRTKTGFEVWDLPSHQRIRSLPMEALSAFRIALSPDDQTFAVLEYSGGNGALRLWNLATGESRVVGDHRAIITGVAFSPDSTRIVTIDGGGSHCWEVATGRSIWHNKERPDDRPIFLPDGKSFLGIDYPGPVIKRWDIASGKPLDDGMLPKLGPNSSLLVSPDGLTLAINTLDKGVRLWNLKAGTEGPVVKDATAVCSFAPDGKTFIGVSGTALGRWELATGRALYPKTDDLGHVGQVNALAFIQHGKQLVSASMYDQTIRLWDIASRKPALQIKNAKINWDVIALTPDGKQIAGALAGINDYGLLQVWDATTGKVTKQLSACDTATKNERVILSALKVSPDSKTLIGIGGVDDDIRGMTQSVVVAWDLSSGRRIFRRNAPRQAAAKCISSDTKLLLCIDGRLFETETGKQLLDLGTSFNQAFDNCVFSSDQSLLAGTQCKSFVEETWHRTIMKEIKVWEVASGNVLARIEISDWLGHLVFTPDRQLLIGTDADAIRVWEVATGREIVRHANIGKVHGEMMFFATSLAVSPDGRTLASGHADTTILLWDLLPPARKGSKVLSAAELGDAWSLLAGADVKRAYAAMGDLAASAQSVKFIQERLKPIVAAPGFNVSIERLLADLDSASFSKRDAAQRQLVKLGELAEPALRKALGQTPSIEQRRRLEQILSTPAPPITPDALRSWRAVQILERIASSEARRHLETLAKGMSEAKLTRLAKGSLDRLAGR